MPWRFYDCLIQLIIGVSAYPFSILMGWWVGGRILLFSLHFLSDFHQLWRCVFLHNTPLFFFFSTVGLLFAILAVLLFVIAYFRARHSAHDFADRDKEAYLLDSGIKTQGREGTRIFGRPFVTAGWSVVQVSVVVAAVELGLLVLIIRRVP